MFELSLGARGRCREAERSGGAPPGKGGAMSEGPGPGACQVCAGNAGEIIWWRLGPVRPGKVGRDQTANHPDCQME